MLYCDTSPCTTARPTKFKITVNTTTSTGHITRVNTHKKIQPHNHTTKQPQNQTIKQPHNYTTTQPHNHRTASNTLLDNSPRQQQQLYSNEQPYLDKPCGLVGLELIDDTPQRTRQHNHNTTTNDKQQLGFIPYQIVRVVHIVSTSTDRQTDSIHRVRWLNSCP